MCCSGGFLHTRGYDPVLAVLLFSGAMALHSRQLDLKLRLDYLWATQVCENIWITYYYSVFLKSFTGYLSISGIFSPVQIVSFFLIPVQ